MLKHVLANEKKKGGLNVAARNGTIPLKNIPIDLRLTISPKVLPAEPVHLKPNIALALEEEEEPPPSHPHVHHGPPQRGRAQPQQPCGRAAKLHPGSGRHAIKLRPQPRPRTIELSLRWIPCVLCNWKKEQGKRREKKTSDSYQVVHPILSSNKLENRSITFLIS